MSKAPTESRLSYRSTADTDPYGFYDRVREEGAVVWDDGMDAWLVTSHGAIREVMRQDNVLVRHTAAELADGPMREILGGRRSRLLLPGDENARHHRWFVRRFSYSVVDVWRTTLLRPIIDRLFDDFGGRGRVEFAGEFSHRYSVRVIAAIMGLPWQDDEWVERCKQLLDRKQHYLDTFRTERPGPITDSALAAARELNELVRPFIEAAREREPREEDIMALLWADGHSIRPGWDIEDMTAWVATTFFAGTDTTTHAIENALYLLATIPGLQQQLRAGGDDAVARFGEEVLRRYGSVQWTFRFANRDFELGGATIAKDDILFMLDAGANRDRARYEQPDGVDLERKSPGDHLAFSFGPRTCAGAALARAEIEETVSKVLERLPNLRLDPDAEPPRFRGFLLRSYRPLHALFEVQR